MLKDIEYPRHLFQGIRPLVGGTPKNRSLRIFGADTETCQGDPLTLQIDGPDCPLFLYTDTEHILPDFWEYAKRCCRHNGVNIFYIHNLNFDLRVLFAAYRVKMYEQRSDIKFDAQIGDDLLKIKMLFGRVNKAEIRCGPVRLSLYCSRLFCQASLKKSLKMFGIPYDKLDSPEGLGRIRYNELPVDDPNRAKFEAYAVMDARAERHLGLKIIEFHKNYDVRPSISLPSYASRVFRRHFLKLGEHIPFPPIDVVKAAEKSYHGGKNGFYLDSPGIIEDCYEVDINSAYPFAMASLPGLTEGNYYRVNEYKPDLLGIYCLSGHIAKASSYSMLYSGKTGYPLIYDHKFNPVPPGPFTDLWHTGFEVAHILGRKSITINRLWGYVWQPSSNARNPFADYSRHFYEKKQSTPKDDPNYHFYKIMLNALYGKLVSTIELESEESRDEITQLQNLGVDIPAGVRIDSRFDPVLKRFISISRGWRAGSMYNPFIATQITGHTRAYLYTLETSLQAVHSATDSVKSTSFMPATEGLGGVKVECYGRCYLFRNKLYLHFSKDPQYCHHKEPPFRYPDRDQDGRPHPRAGKPLVDNDGQHLCKIALHGYKGPLWRLFDERDNLLRRGYMDYSYEHVVGLREGLKRGLKVCDFITIPGERLDLRSHIPDDLLTFIRKRGGINLSRDGGDFERFTFKECHIRGLTSRLTGLSPDHMRESVAEAGYPLGESCTINDLWELIDRAVRSGKKIYSMEDEAEMASLEEPEEIIQDLGAIDEDEIPF